MTRCIYDSFGTDVLLFARQLENYCRYLFFAWYLHRLEKISDTLACHGHRSRSFFRGFKVTRQGYELFCCR